MSSLILCASVFKCTYLR